MTNYLRLLGNRHCCLGIPAANYPKFADSLLTTLEEFHGPQWDGDLADQWRAACSTAIKLMVEGHAVDFQTP